MKVNIISLNVDGLKESPKLKIPSGLDSNPDIYAEFTQEDSRNVKIDQLNPVRTIYDPDENIYSPAITGGSADNITLIDSVYLKDMNLVAHISLNPTATSQNIITNIFLKRGLRPSNVETGVIVVKPSQGKLGKIKSYVQSHLTGYSKGCVWVKIIFQSSSILFLNMHLPVDTGDKKTLGYPFRKKMFYKLLRTLSDKVDRHTSVIVGGDLNFRMHDTQDQLTDLLRNSTRNNRDSLPIPLKELSFPPGQEPAFTCKFKEHSDKTCRLTPIAELPDDTSLHCADEHRTLSRCDRFLVNGDPRVSIYNTAVLLDGSDHNAIFASFDTTTVGGGRRRTRRKKHSDL